LKEFEIVEGCRMCYGDKWGMTDGVQRISYVCIMGGVMEDGGEEKMRYNGGSRKCMLVREGMGVEELREMVRKTVGVGVEVDMM